MNEPASQSGSFDFNQPTIVALMYLASILTGFTMLIGVILAYVWKDEGSGWETTHMRFHIRTFWIGLVLGMVAFVPTILTLGLAAFIVYPALLIWVAVRTIKAMLAAQKQLPVSNVETWLW